MSAPRLSPGQVVAGKYTIRAALAYGGSSATYGAVTAAGREVIVRMLSPQLASRNDVLGALSRAAAVTNGLPADSTAPILDSAFNPQTGAPFVVTEALPLPTLAQTVARGVLPPTDVALLLRGMARSVDAAHAQRLAHGALKPQNIFVAASADKPTRVVDFAAGVPRAALPTAEGRAGAAPWMAPEQLQATTDGPAVDVFSAALVAFFAATGRSYWRSCQGATPDLNAWQQEVVAPRTPPSARAKELGSFLQPSWDAILGRALSPDPAARFASIGALADALANASPTSPHAMTMPLSALPFAPPQTAPYAFNPGGGPAQGPPPPAAPAPAPDMASAMVAPPAPAQYATEAPEIPRSRGGLAIVLAIVGVAVIGIVITLVVVLRKPAADAGPVASASVPAASASAPAPTPSASVAAAVPSAAPSEAPSAAAAPTETADAAPAAETAELTVVCVPECDTVTVDDGALDGGLTDPLELAAGAHTVVVGKATYLSQTRKLTLKAGEKQKATFFLSKPGPAPSKPCGKFLQRCP